jgi:cobalt/nickel transport system permease protein
VHIPDGFINAPVSIAAGAASLGALAASARRVSEELAERAAPLAGLVAAFVFAAQMLNFPVAAGTSGHLLGGVLAAVLVGPWTGAICIALVLFVQALVFADGGLSALGLNVVNMAVIGALGGYVVFRALRGALPRTRSGVVVASGVAAGISVVLAAIGFWVEYALGGTVGVDLGTVFGAMVGVHLLIGLGEGVITALTVGAVMSVRPDLVHGARDLVPSAAPAPSGAPSGG